MALLEDEIHITAKVGSGIGANGGAKKVELELRACSDEICPVPDTVKFTISPPCLVADFSRFGYRTH